MSMSVMAHADPPVPRRTVIPGDSCSETITFFFLSFYVAVKMTRYLAPLRGKMRKKRPGLRKSSPWIQCQVWSRAVTRVGRTEGPFSRRKGPCPDFPFLGFTMSRGRDSVGSTELLKPVENFYRSFIGAKLTTCAGAQAPECPGECQFCRFFCVFEMKEGA